MYVICTWRDSTQSLQGASGRVFSAAGGWKQSKVSFSETGEINCGENNVGYRAAAGNNKLDVNKAT